MKETDGGEPKATAKFGAGESSATSHKGSNLRQTVIVILVISAFVVGSIQALAWIEKQKQPTAIDRMSERDSRMRQARATAAEDGAAELIKLHREARARARALAAEGRFRAAERELVRVSRLEDIVTASAGLAAYTPQVREEQRASSAEEHSYSTCGGYQEEGRPLSAECEGMMAQ